MSETVQPPPHDATPVPGSPWLGKPISAERPANPAGYEVLGGRGAVFTAPSPPEAVAPESQPVSGESWRLRPELAGPAAAAAARQKEWRAEATKLAPEWAASVVGGTPSPESPQPHRRATAPAPPVPPNSVVGQRLVPRRDGSTQEGAPLPPPNAASKSTPTSPPAPSTVGQPPAEGSFAYFGAEASSPPQAQLPPEAKAYRRAARIAEFIGMAERGRAVSQGIVRLPEGDPSKAQTPPEPSPPDPSTPQAPSPRRRYDWEIKLEEDRKRRIELGERPLAVRATPQPNVHLLLPESGHAKPGTLRRIGGAVVRSVSWLGGGGKL